MSLQLSFIGFGEAAQAFAPAIAKSDIDACAFDILLDGEETSQSCWDRITGADVVAKRSHHDAVGGAAIILSLVTADQSLAAAQQVAEHISADALYCDMNSVAPGTKQVARDAIEHAGGRYVDVAIMAPVHPARENVPLLISGPHARAAEQMLAAIGFTNIRVIGDQVGQASAIKMIRSIMIKGTEALTAEMILAAREAGVEEEVLTSLGDRWTEKAAYNLERMETHGARRAAEMAEVARTLETLNVEPVMTRGTIIRQREMAKRGTGE